MRFVKLLYTSPGQGISAFEQIEERRYESEEKRKRENKTGKYFHKQSQYLIAE